MAKITKSAKPAKSSKMDAEERGEMRGTLKMNPAEERGERMGPKHDAMAKGRKGR